MIGVFGGTFDPPHFGHLNLAIELAERHSLEEVWFCPANTNPFKRETQVASSTHRKAMVDLAVEGIPRCRISTIEMERSGVSYTIDTLRELVSRFPDKEFGLILGSDGLNGFCAWHQPHEIVQLAHLLIGTRNRQSPPEALRAFPDLFNAVVSGWTPIPQFDVSSTEVRQRLQQKLYCGHLVPTKVLDYITAHQLY